MQTRTLGTNGPQASALSLGLMGMSGRYGPADEAESIATVHAAPDAGSWLGYDARPAAVQPAAAYSLQRLNTDRIDIYRPARLDPNVPIEETVGAIADLVQAGYVHHVGLSEVGADTIRLPLVGARSAEAQPASLDSERSTSAS